MLQIPSQSISLEWTIDKFTPTMGQITFILSRAPIDPNSVEISVNGVEVDDPSEYNVSGVNVTWLSTYFSLAPTDIISVRYQ